MNEKNSDSQLLNLHIDSSVIQVQANPTDKTILLYTKEKTIQQVLKGYIQLLKTKASFRRLSNNFALHYSLFSQIIHCFHHHSLLLFNRGFCKDNNNMNIYICNPNNSNIGNEYMLIAKDYCKTKCSDKSMEVKLYDRQF